MDMDYEQAASYWEKQDAAAKKMDRGTLAARAEEFLAAHNTCALATGHGAHVRCTPIEYTYRQGCFWLLSEGGEKFRNLKENDPVHIDFLHSDFKKLGFSTRQQLDF